MIETRLGHEEFCVNHCSWDHEIAAIKCVCRIENVNRSFNDVPGSSGNLSRYHLVMGATGTESVARTIQLENICRVPVR